MKRILLLISIVISNLYLIAQDSISVGFYAGLSAAAYSDTPAYMPRIGNFTIYIVNNFKHFRYDSGLKLDKDYYTINKIGTAGETYKATIRASFISLYADAAFKLYSTKSHHGDLQFGISLIKCLKSTEEQQYADRTINRKLGSNSTNIVVSCGYRASFPLGKNWVINVKPNVNYKLFEVRVIDHPGLGTIPVPTYYYNNFRFYYGIDVGLEYIFKK